MNEFVTVEENGIIYPQRFIVRNNEAAEYAKEAYKLDEGENFVVVEMVRK